MDDLVKKATTHYRKNIIIASDLILRNDTQIKKLQRENEFLRKSVEVDKQKLDKWKSGVFHE